MNERVDISRKRPHPALIAAGAGLLVVVAAFLPVLWSMWKTPPPSAAAVDARDAGAPWSIEVLPDGGTRVFGLHLPGAMLVDVRNRWGDDLELALMSSRGETPVLEASVERAVVGGVVGRLLFTADAAPQDLQRWREHAPKEEPVSADTRRVALSAEDRAAALHTPLAGIGFIPTAQLDAAVLRERFGDPAEVARRGEPVEHWLYPRLGLAIALDAKGRELLQYVPPAQFERRLRAPLFSPVSTPASGPPG